MVVRPCTWLSLLREPVFDGDHLPVFTVGGIDWPGLSNGVGVSHPYLWANRKGFTMQSEKKKRAIRMRLLGCPEFAASVLGENFVVAQPNWPKEVEEAFGLEDPPTPYEVASILLIQRNLMHGLPIPPLGKSAVLWWLGGVSESALDLVMPGWEEEAAKLVRGLMSRPVFALWALGTDLSPLLTNRAKARALLSLDIGKYRTEREKLFRGYYVQTLLQSGQRINPVERRLPVPTPLWANHAERESHRDEGWHVRLERFRREARDILGEEFEVEDVR